MPTVVKKTGSIFILSTYITSILIAVTYGVGSELLASYDSRQSITHLEEKMDKISKKMDNFIIISHANKLAVMVHEVELKACMKDIEKCEERTLNHKH